MSISDNNTKKKASENVLLAATTQITKEYIPHLYHELNVVNALTFMTPLDFPYFTNFTKDFKDILDYIYVDRDHLTVVRIPSVATVDELSEELAIPSRSFPSDHVAVVVDLMFSSDHPSV